MTLIALTSSRESDDIGPADRRDAPTLAVAPSGESVLALTEAMARGDRDAYAGLFRARCDFVEREAARRVGRRRDLVDDVSQETWIRVARGPRRFEAASSLDAWLARIVGNAAVDILRSELARRAREERVARSRSEAREFLADVEVLEALGHELALVEGLSGEERSLLELRARTGATLTQLAAMLGLGRAAVDSRLRRASQLARRSIEGRSTEGETP